MDPRGQTHVLPNYHTASPNLWGTAPLMQDNTYMPNRQASPQPQYPSSNYGRRASSVQSSGSTQAVQPAVAYDHAGHGSTASVASTSSTSAKPHKSRKRESQSKGVTTKAMPDAFFDGKDTDFHVAANDQARCHHLRFLVYSKEYWTVERFSTQLFDSRGQPAFEGVFDLCQRDGNKGHARHSM
jgi:hypothetical protein